MAYVKSILWLLGTTALGYTLLLITAHDEKIIAEKYPNTNTSDAIKKRQAIIDTLRSAAESNNPMYRQSKDQIDKDIHSKK